MKAVRFEKGQVILENEHAIPAPKPEDLLIKVHAAGLNRVDLMHFEGKWRPADFASPIPGIEISGEVMEMGSDVKGFKKGDRVFGFTHGGAFAEYALLDHLNAIRLPEGWTHPQGAAIVEVFLTANERLFTNGHLKAGQTVLIHAGGSGVGTAAIQLAHLKGAKVLTTTGSKEKIDRCLLLGADHGINYKEENFADKVLEWTEEAGVDLIIDLVGADYLQRNLQALKPDGTLVIVGLVGGSKAEINLIDLILKRHTLVGNNMTRRKVEEVREITKRFVDQWYPSLVSGEIKPIIAKTFPLENLDEAFEYMKENKNFGKIILIIKD